jgi:hypothetical protein
MIEYVGAAAAFSSLAAFSESRAGASLMPLLALATPVILLCLWAISIPHALRGLAQRVAETTIFAGVVLTGLWVYKSE